MTDFWTTMQQFWTGSVWSGWVMAIVIINYGSILFLFIWASRVKIPTAKDGTTGHVWANGSIREGLRSFPKWWLLLSTAMFVGAFIYLILYPGFGHSKGVLGWTSYGQMQTALKKVKKEQKPLWKRIEDTPVLALSKDPEAMHLGHRLFDDNCAACHGYDAKGSILLGAPNLTDNTWEYGGSVDTVIQTITHGRNGMMPAWGDGLGEKKVWKLTNYVQSLSGTPDNAWAAKQGKALFATNCVACHGADAKGKQVMGAPDLTDDVWKWGSTYKDIHHTIYYGRNGHMPNWDKRLSKSEIRVIAAWVLSHGNDQAALKARGPQ